MRKKGKTRVEEELIKKILECLVYWKGVRFHGIMLV